jgi:hypothetical protein
MMWKAMGPILLAPRALAGMSISSLAQGGVTRLVWLSMGQTSG